jgi:hypothetical protein
MGYKITFTLTALPLSTDNVVIWDGVDLYYYQALFVTARTFPNEVVIGSNISRTIDNIASSFALDYNTGSAFETENTPTQFIFWSDTYFSGGVPVVETNTTSGRVTVLIEEMDAELSITETNITGTCNEIDVEVMCNLDIDTISTAYGTYDVIPASDTAVVSYERELIGRTENITVHSDTLSVDDTESIFVPSLLLESMITVNQAVNPFSAIITVTDTTDGLTLEYSINGTDYQSESVFYNVVEGSYILYIRDQFACEVEIPFEVVLSAVTEPYFHISKSNALRFSKIETIDNCSTFQTDENILSCESWVNLPYRQKQLFTTCDVIKTQFKSNYTTNEVQLLQYGAVVATITPTKISNNIGLSQKIDAKIVSLGGDVYGVYFISGNIYDYNTESVIGTYDLAGELPEWAIIGNWVLIEGIFYQIENITFNETFNAWQFEYSSTINDSGDKIIGALWNNENYEIYEFLIVCTALLDNYTVKINSSDDLFNDIYHVSEIINIETNQAGTLHIEYWNDENTDFFITDWHHIIRVPFLSINPEIDNESELFKSDDTATIYDISNYEVNKFVFLPQTTEINRKLIVALSHKNVKINGVLYAKKSIEIEQQGSTNLQTVSASMVKASIYL